MALYKLVCPVCAKHIIKILDEPPVELVCPRCYSRGKTVPLACTQAPER